MKYQSRLTLLLKSLQTENNLEIKLTQVLSDIDRRLQNLEERVGKIPDPFVLYYRPPERDSHEKISDVLDDIHIRIGMLEEML